MWSWVSVAWACGGAESYPLDAPLRPPESHLEATLESFDGFDLVYAPVTRFLHALQPTDPELYAALESVLAGGDPVPPETPTLVGFHSALRRGDRDGARKSAAEVVERLLDLPSPLASPEAEILRPVVEYLEIEPRLRSIPAQQVAEAFTGGPIRHDLLARSAEVRGLDPAAATGILERRPDHPRRASLRWLELRQAMKADLPDGWTAEEIADATPPGVRDALLARADAWLADYPDHPLADHARLAKVRILYLTGDADPAWPILADLYRRHPARAADELRFLLRQGRTPKGLEPASLPFELAVALAPSLELDGAAWSRLWTEAVERASLPAQERLLLAVARGSGDLPAAFPGPGAPTGTWAHLRLQALAARDLREEAWAQSELQVGDPAVAPVRAWLRLTRGDWAGALREPGLDPSSVTYLMRVLAPDQVLRGVQDDPELGAEARRILALRGREAPRGWQEGRRLLQPVDPARAELWAEGARLSEARGPDAPLAYARFLLRHAGAIFGGRGSEDIVFYRSLPVSSPDDAPRRAPGLPFDLAAEWEGTRRWLTSSFATWEALQSFAAWLALPAGQRGSTPVARVVAEADAAYNALLNYGSFDFYAWSSIVVDSEEARVVRARGRESNPR